VASIGQCFLPDPNRISDHLRHFFMEDLNGLYDQQPAGLADEVQFDDGPGVYFVELECLDGLGSSDDFGLEDPV
jgi:hypothetical protein